MNLLKSELCKYIVTVLVMYLPMLLVFFVLGNRASLVGFVMYSCITLCLFLLFNINRSWALPVVLISLPYSMFVLFTGNDVGYQVLASIYDTNMQEATEFILAPLVLLFLVLTVCIFIVFNWLIIRRKSFNLNDDRIFIRKKWLYTIMALSVLTLIILTPFGFIFREVYPISFIYKNYRYYHETYSVVKNHRNSVRSYEIKGTLEVIPDVPEIYILIIGEAARKHSMSIYGYERNTTPLLSSYTDREKRSNLVVFEDAIAVAPFSRVSVPSMLSTLNAKNFHKIFTQPSFIELFKQAGFKIFLASNQSSEGFHSDLISAFMEGLSGKTYLSVRNSKKNYDADLLPVVDGYLDNPATKKLIIVHLAGSHFEYKRRYPDNHAYFQNTNLVDTYDNSIRYSDYVIGSIIKKMSNREEAISLLYTSDHGENLNDYKDYNYGHGAKRFTKFELEIPFIFWCNKEFYKLKNSKVENVFRVKAVPVSHDNMSHTLLGLAGIYADLYKNAMDLSSPGFKESERYVVDRSMNILPASKIGDVED